MTAAVLLLAGCNEPPGQRELERGAREIGRGNFNAARTQLEKSIAARSGSEQNLEAYNCLGIANWKLGRTQDAMEAFESARRLSPVAPEPTYNLGVLCAESGDPARALQLLKDAALMDEKDSRPLEYMGAIYVKKQQWPEARRAFYAARSRAPDSPRILTSLALVEAQTEQPETAIATLMSALSHDANYAPALFDLGAIYQTRMNDAATARTFFQRFLAVTNSGPHADIARRMTAAVPVANHGANPAVLAATRPPSATLTAQPEAFSGSADLFARARDAADHGRNDDALNLCLQAAQQAAARGDKTAQEAALRLGTQLFVDSPRAHTELGNFLLAQGQQPDAALRAFRAAVTLNDSYAPAFLGLGKAATATREFDTALVGLKQAVRADPSSADALWLLAQLYDKNIERPSNAQKCYSDFLKLFPSDSRAALARERLRSPSIGRGANPPAENSVPPRPAVILPAPPRPAAATPSESTERNPPQTLPSKLSPDDVNPDIAAVARPVSTAERNPSAARQAFSRATDYQQRGDWNNALFYYEQAVRNDDSLNAAWFNLGAGYSLRGDTAKAKDAYLRTLELKPDFAEARYNLAVLCIESKDFAAAEKMLADLAQRKPDYANAWLALGQVYAHNAATLPQAKAAYKKFLDLAPTSRSAPSVRQWLQAQ